MQGCYQSRGGREVMSKDRYDYESTPSVMLHGVDGESCSLLEKEVSLATPSFGEGVSKQPTPRRPGARA